MILFDLLSLIPVIFGSAIQSPEQATVSRVVIQEQLIIGVPLRPRVSRPIEWEEKKGPKCIPGRAIAGALLSSDRTIDFVLRDRSRVRAKMGGDCPALDYYERFYLQPDDENVCAGRDTIRTRMGGTCQIDKFKVLKPKFRD